MRIRLLLLTLLLVTPACLYAQSNNAYINVGEAQVKKSLAAIAPIRFLGTPTLSKTYLRHEKELYDVLEKDLTVASYFSIQNPSAFLEQDKGLRPKQMEPNGFDYEAWKSIGTEFLIKTGFNVAGDTMTFEAYVYNVNQREMVFGRSYSAPLRDLRSVAHKFCNDLLEKISGVKPFFLTKVAVARSAGRNEKEIFVMDWDGANAQAVTNSKTISVSPTWSRDGRYVAYSAFLTHRRTKMRNMDLFIYDLKTRERSLLSAQRGLNSTASFFPDQRDAVIRISPNNGTSDLYKISLASKEKTAITNGPRGAMNVEPRVSPDGRKLAFSSDRSGKAMIYVHDFGSNATTKLTHAGQYNSTPAWSPDGTKIAFAGNRDSHFDIYIMDVDGKNMRRLTDSRKASGRGANHEDPSFSPDGRFIMFRSDRTGNYQLYVVSVDGKNEYRLTFDNHNYYQPQWSPYLN